MAIFFFGRVSGLKMTARLQPGLSKKKILPRGQRTGKEIRIFSNASRKKIRVQSCQTPEGNNKDLDQLVKKRWGGRGGQGSKGIHN
eukprot:scaffold10181_cov66-Cyclotella_meneghiniana.AAC.1